MSKAVRMLAMSGMAAVGALTFSAGPAAAADASPAPAASSSSAASPAPAASKPATEAASRSRIVTYYRSPIACNQAGRAGEWRRNWDDYTCYRVPFGFKRGWFALQVRWNNHGFPGHGPGFPGHGPHFPGHGPIFPGPHFPLKK